MFLRRLKQQTSLCVLGVRTDEPALFANSWIVDLPRERACPSVELDFDGPCQSESDMDVRNRNNAYTQAYYAMFFFLITSLWKPVQQVEVLIKSKPECSFNVKQMCSVILNSLYVQDAIEKCSALLFFPFLSCHENIDPNPFVAGCVSDLCL